MGYCHKCEGIFPDQWLTTCYAYDDMRVIGVLCDECLQGWFEYERRMGEE